MSNIIWNGIDQSSPPHPWYGNYGGGGWSAGQKDGDPAASDAPAPVDNLDEGFRVHDIVYHGSTDPYVRYLADRALIEHIYDIRTDPSSHWNDGTMDANDQRYGQAAELVFETFVRNYEIQNNIPLADRYNDPDDPDDPNTGADQHWSDPLFPPSQGGPYDFWFDPVGLPDPERRPPWDFPNNPFDFPPISPLIIDLDGDGVETTSLDGSNIFFDLDGDGFAERTGWVSADDALIVHDVNANGEIDDISELFGNETTDGFTELSVHDTNGNGLIDTGDSLFTELRLWQDLDQDGRVDQGELMSFAHAGLTSINLNATLIAETNAGNDVTHRSSATWSDGTQSNVDDVWFQNDQMRTQYQLPDGFVLDYDTLWLPPIQGYGTVAPLTIAMSEDAALKTLVEDLVADIETLTALDFLGRIESIVLQWTGAHAIDPASRGLSIDAQHLGVLEAFYGRDFVAAGGGANPGSEATIALEWQYSVLIETMAARFLVQAPHSNVLTSVTAPDAANSQFAPFLSASFDLQDDAVTYSLQDMLNALVSSWGAGPVALADLEQAGRIISWLGHDFDAVGTSFGDEVQSLVSALSLSQAEKDHFLIFAQNSLTTAIGTNGDDSLTGTFTDDTLYGFLGNDYLEGSQGSDTYVFGRGAGQDEIHDHGYRSTDRLLIEDYLPSEVAVFQGAPQSGDLVITFAGTSDQITVRGTLNSSISNEIEEIVFDDGTVWTMAYLRERLIAEAATDGDDNIYGFFQDDIITGGLGNDYLEGSQGSDTYVFVRGDGQDTIHDRGYQSTDRLLIEDYLPSEALVSRATPSSSDLVISFTGSSDQITVRGTLSNSISNQIEEILFDDGTVWTMAYLRERLLTESRTTGDDAIYGFFVDDVLIGGQGNDYLEGSQGSDTYMFSRGDGQDVIHDRGYGSLDRLLIEGYRESELTLSRPTPTSKDLVITFAGTSDQITVRDTLTGSIFHQIEQIVFDNGTIWSIADVVRFLGQIGTSAGEAMTGTADVDRLVGGGGNDTFVAGAGDDLMIGGAGADSFDGGAGTDTVSYAQAAAGVYVHMGDTAQNTGDAAGDSYTSIEVLEGSAFGDTLIGGADRFVGGDGNDSITATSNAGSELYGGADDDNLYGGVGDDIIDFGTGDDFANGGAGADTFIFKAGYGSDKISGFEGGAGVGDVIEFESSLVADYTALQGYMNDWGSPHIFIDFGNGDLITLWDTAMADLHADDFRFVSDAPPTNTDPVAVADGGFSTDLDVAVTIASSAILANDTDLDGDTLSIQSVQDPVNGSVALDINGDVVFTPSAGHTGPASFTYTVSDSNGGTSTAQVDLMVETATPAPIVIERRVTSSADDVEEDASGTVYLDSTDIELVDDTTFSGADQTVGLRFTNLDIPQGAIITSAWLQFQVDEVDSGTISLEIRAQDADDAGAFTTANNDVSSRTTTSALVSWQPSAWTVVGEAGPEQRTPDLMSVVQEIIDRQGWAPNNDIAFVITGSGERTAVSFDSDAGAAPLLHIEYQLPSAGGTATSGDDILVGTVGHDIIDGLAGNDTINGNDGDDVLIGGAGADSLDGGNGVDTASYSTAMASVYVHMGDTAQNTGDAAGDSYTSIEVLEGSAFADTLIGGVTIHGGAGDDTIYGNSSAGQQLSGGDGNDVIHSNSGADTISGGAGDDTVISYGGDDIITLGDGDDYSAAGDGNDTIDGGAGADEIRAGAGNDTLLGGAGDDSLHGDDGDDIIDFGLGDDYATGGAGNDTFIFKAGYGSDKIGGFEGGAGVGDVIEFESSLVADYTALQGYMNDWGSPNTFIDFGNGDVITLWDTVMTDLHADDFRFVA